MSLALTIYYVALQGVQALPIGTCSEVLVASPSPPNVRAKPAIIWSCLVTIFSCTWLAVHPNIPGPDTPRWVIFLHRVRLMVVAMIAPEAVIAWAIRQWISAYKLGNKYRKYGWTQSHGYFAIMGGFMIFEGDKAQRIVKPDELEELLKNNEIRITKAEIRDKGRADALSKGLILIQTTWFILQCIARKAERLPITELELVTLAFAALNFVTYAVWWNKPLNVECAVRVYRKGAAVEKAVAGGTGDTESGQGESRVWSMITKDIKAARATAAPVQASHSSSIAIAHNTPSLTRIRRVLGAAREGLQDYVSEYRWHVVWHLLAALLSPVCVPWGYVFIILMRLGTGDDDDVIEGGAKRIPTFHVGKLTLAEDTLAASAATAIATIFGGIHCVAWSFEFPSHIEQLLWRIASIAITSAPSLFFILTLVAYLRNSPSGFRIPGWAEWIMAIILWFCSAVYIISRLILLVLPFMSLRSLPAEVYQTVQWTTFIPHV